MGLEKEAYEVVFVFGTEERRYRPLAWNQAEAIGLAVREGAAEFSGIAPEFVSVAKKKD